MSSTTMLNEHEAVLPERSVAVHVDVVKPIRYCVVPVVLQLTLTEPLLSLDVGDGSDEIVAKAWFRSVFLCTVAGQEIEGFSSSETTTL